jgi:hypothetical protein
MMRLLANIVCFGAGAGVGIVWGVHHPTQAADIAQREQVAASKAKIEFLQKFGADIPNSQQMITDEQKKLDAATQPSS